MTDYQYTPYPRAWIEFANQPVFWTDITSLSVELTATWEADALDVTLDNSRLYSDFLKIEQDVRVWLGRVADPNNWSRDELVKVFDGKIDGVLPHFGPEMTVQIRARDMSRAPIDTELTAGLSNMTASDFAKWLGQKHHLTVKTVETTDEFDMEQFEKKSHWEILQTMAIREGLIAYVDRDRVLHLEARKDDNPPLGIWHYREEPFDILQFDPDNSALIPNVIKVVNWVGKDADGNALNGYVEGCADDKDRIAAMDDRVVERVVYSKTAVTPVQCEAEAKAILKEQTRDAYTASLVVVGDPRLSAEVRIDVAGTVGRFANAYYIAKATHSLSTKQGYRTSCDLQSLEPLASDQYRDWLTSQFDAEEAAAVASAAAQAGITVPQCQDAGPRDWAAEWPEFNGPIQALLIANNLSKGAEGATCGPIAAAGILKAYGVVTDPGQLAKKGSDNHWWSPGGMNGPDAETSLIASLGVNAKNLGHNLDEAIRRTSQCIPVVFDCSGNPGHYLLASAYRKGDGKFFVGVTGTPALRLGAEWMSPADMAAIAACGPIRSVIVVDQAQAIAPSTLKALGPHMQKAAAAQPQLAKLIMQYWPSEEWEMAACVSARESEGLADQWRANEKSQNENYYLGQPYNDLSYGWFQVNISPGDRYRGAANNPNDLVPGVIFDPNGWTWTAIKAAKARLLSDPDFEVHAAFNIWKGQGWGAWTTRALALQDLGRAS